MKLTWLTITLALLVAVPCVADEIQDAAELLDLSLKCPIKPVVWDRGAKRGTYTYHLVNKSSGNIAVLAVTTVKTDAYGNEDVDFSVRVPFAVLGRTSIETGAGDLPQVHFWCASGDACIRSVDGSGFPINHGWLSFCDVETAKQAKEAVDILIKAGKR